MDKLLQSPFIGLQIADLCTLRTIVVIASTLSACGCVCVTLCHLFLCLHFMCTHFVTHLLLWYVPCFVFPLLHSTDTSTNRSHHHTTRITNFQMIQRDIWLITFTETTTTAVRHLLNLHIVLFIWSDLKSGELFCVVATDNLSLTHNADEWRWWPLTTIVV